MALTIHEADVIDLQVQRYLQGYAQAEADMAARWDRIARPIAGYGGRNHPGEAELERRRWGPGGRERFADPRPGDYPGRGLPACGRAA